MGFHENFRTPSQVEQFLSNLSLNGRYLFNPQKLILGEGQHGVVLFAREASKVHTYAIKVFRRGHGQFAQQEEEALAIANRVAPDLSIRLVERTRVELPRNDTREVLITEYGGSSLCDLYIVKEDARISFEEFKKLLEACVEYYKNLYDEKWEHGDLHPDNIVFDGEKIRFIDYGETNRWGDKADYQRTALPWRSPATLFGKANGTDTSFPLGCSLVAVLTGASLFSNKDPKKTSIQNMQRHVEEVFSLIPPTEKFYQQVPHEIKSIFCEGFPQRVSMIEETLGRELLKKLSGDDPRMPLPQNIQPERFIHMFVDFLKLMLQYEEAPNPTHLQEHPFVCFCLKESSSD